MNNTVSSNLSSLANMFSGASKNGQNLSELTNQNFGKTLDKTAIKDAANELSGKGLMQSYQMQFMQASFTQSGSNFSLQIGLASFGASSSLAGSSLSASMTMLNITGSFGNNTSANVNDLFKMIDFSAIGYSGKPLNTLSQSEAADLVSDKGFFGMENTAKRVADFVIQGAGNDLEKLKAGKEGVIDGFNQAQKLWGGNLPEISQKTQEMLLKMIDERINELGGNVMSMEA